MFYNETYLAQFFSLNYWFLVTKILKLNNSENPLLIICYPSALKSKIWFAVKLLKIDVTLYPIYMGFIACASSVDPYQMAHTCNYVQADLDLHWLHMW
jgi:hypothetical protein